ncbi:MAG: hypothetical protein JKY54_19115 [Flavobacteriales bacterium]|nr:hypothetical protein [Flavobacteriales bacterium]
MNYREFTTALAVGALKNLALTDPNDKSVILTEHLLMVVTHLNQGLTALYSRFLLSEKLLILDYTPGTSFYYLRNEFAKSNTTDVVPVKYIDDEFTEDFTEDIIRVVTVYDSEGVEVPLNEPDEELSVFLPQYDCLQITDVHEESSFSILYQARHKIISGLVATQEIQLPFFLEDALQSYVAGKIISNMGGKDNAFKGIELMTNYENICVRSEQKDLTATSMATENSKLDNRGFS